MRVLVIDDDKSRHKTFARNLIGHEHVVHVHTYSSAVDALRYERFDCVFFDHDLNLIGDYRSVEVDPDIGIEYERNGADIAKALVEMGSEHFPKMAIVHSFNPTGAQNIISILRDAGISVEWNLFGAQSGLEIEGR